MIRNYRYSSGLCGQKNRTQPQQAVFILCFFGANTGIGFVGISDHSKCKSKASIEPPWRENVAFVCMCFRPDFMMHLEMFFTFSR